MEGVGRLLTKEAKAISRGEKSKVQKSGKQGLVVKSAEGLRFAHTNTALPTTVIPEVEPVVPEDQSNHALEPKDAELEKRNIQKRYEDFGDQSTG